MLRQGKLHEVFGALKALPLTHVDLHSDTAMTGGPLTPGDGATGGICSLAPMLSVCICPSICLPVCLLIV
jgi:hypothetical protein